MYLSRNGETVMLSIRNDITKVKQINVDFIKSALKDLGSATKAEIAKTTGISVAACGKILNELCESGEVQEDEILSSGYGRPAKSYVYNGDFSQIACIYVETDAGKSKLSVVVTNLLGEIQKEYIKEMTEVTTDLIIQELAALSESYPKLRSVAVGIPGYILNGVVDLCNFANLIGVSLQSKLQEQFPDMEILVENDMNAAAYGYYQVNCKEKSSPIAFLYSPVDPQTGLENMPQDLFAPEQERQLRMGVRFGAGFVSEGQILRGATGFSGEVSFIPMPELLDLDSDDGKLAMTAHIIGSIVPILNPGVIVLSGGFFDESKIEEIKENCLRLIAPQHMPEIILHDDIHDDYINGLLNLAQAELSCSVALVERKF